MNIRQLPSTMTLLQGGLIVLLGVSAIFATPPGPAIAEEAEQSARVVSIGGSVTEIIYALGEEDRLVARDSTSSFPSDTAALPDVGYMRALSAEGVLSVNPDLIVSAEGAGPPETLDLLEAASVPFVKVPEDYSREGIKRKILTIGDALKVPLKAKALSTQLDAALKQAEDVVRSSDVPPKRVLFILSTQGGRILASGTNTAANGIIEMSGGINAVTAFEGYKPLTDEAVSAAAPDVILMMDRDGDHSADNKDLFSMPAIQTTPAAANQSVIRMNGLLLLGFGPRTAEAVLELNRQLNDG